MPTPPFIRFHLFAAVLLFASSAYAQPDPAPAEPAEPEADPLNELIADDAITVNADQRYVDLDSRVCLRSAEFLEMFVCTPDTREHESILVTDAVPHKIHLALLLLGAEPGAPLSYDMAFDPPRLIPASGPTVRVSIVIEQDGETTEVPANTWIRDNQTQRAMQDNAWVFAGSQIETVAGENVYYADVNGSVISLVNFGDDLLTLSNDMTQNNDSHNQVWAPRTQAIPEVGTDVIVRLRLEPIEEEDEDPEQPE